VSIQEASRLVTQLPLLKSVTRALYNEALPAASGRGIGLNTAPQGAGY